MHQPRISVCIPTYNYGRYISQAIESVLNQTVTDFELLVVDDFSKDATDDIVRRYAAQDSRIRYIRHKKNQGMVANWNYCLREARGIYIKFLFADDFFTSTQTLEKMLTAMESDETISLVGSSRVIVDENLTPKDVWRHNDSDILENGIDVINTCMQNLINSIGEPTAVMFKKTQSGRGFDPKYRQLVDLEMWFYLLEQGKYLFLNEPLCAFRVHSEQQTAKNAKLNASIVDTYYLYDDYLGKRYTNISWFSSKYIKFDYIYKIRKSYLRNKSNHKTTYEIIDHFGFFGFYLLLPLYKTYKPIAKIILQSSQLTKFIFFHLSSRNTR
ncbi:MAG: glycosyltransferase family 2 protein [Desulfuromonadales bacterium]|nr:glycosyltransferase family 2 protein [Desulfuromonadales bacterium]